MENDAPQISRWEAIKQYGAGYGVVVVLTALFVYFAMEPDPEAPNAGYIFGYIFGGAGVILGIPFLFAWLGQKDTPKRRFVLFLALWIIIVALMSIGIFFTSEPG